MIHYDEMIQNDEMIHYDEMIDDYKPNKNGCILS